MSPFGIGDTKIFDLIIPSRYNWGTWALGPLLSIPTATENTYGSGKWAVGGAFGLSLNNEKMGKWQADILLEYLHSIAGKKTRNDINEIELQPSITYHLNRGYYIETEPVFQYNIENNLWDIPINLRFGKVLAINEHKYNVYIEPETTLYSNKSDYMSFGIRFGFRFLFKE